MKFDGRRWKDGDEKRKIDLSRVIPTDIFHSHSQTNDSIAGDCLGSLDTGLQIICDSGE